jgi:oligopeptide transport system ATP-binding protein
LDISIQAQIINLFFEFRKKRNLAILFIAHKLSVISYFSDTFAVMHKGKIVELAPAEELFSIPRHQYTQAMLSAAPIIDPGEERTRERLKYDVKEEKGMMTLISTNHYVLEEKI